MGQFVSIKDLYVDVDHYIYHRKDFPQFIYGLALFFQEFNTIFWDLFTFHLTNQKWKDKKMDIMYLNKLFPVMFKSV